MRNRPASRATRRSSLARTQVFAARTRDEWTAALADVDGCSSPVLSLGEVAGHPHLQARNAFPAIDGIPQPAPAPAPRFGRTRPTLRTGPPAPGEHTLAALADWGFADDELRRLHDGEAIR